MSKRKPRTRQIRWKKLGFIPDGWDESRMIKYGDEGFLYLCRQLRDDWRSFSGFSVYDRNFRPGQGGCNVSHDWTGLEEALQKPASNLSPPPTVIKLTYRKLSAEEREELGQAAHCNWIAVRSQQRAAGQTIPDSELRSWEELLDEEKEVFRRGGESLALPEEAMWHALAEERKMMGERAFRRKMFELSVSTFFHLTNRNWTDAEHYRATDMIVKLSGMLEVPAEAETTKG